MAKKINSDFAILDVKHGRKALAMREAAAERVLSLRELGGIGGYNTALEYAAKQIRALPLPVSADGKDAGANCGTNEEGYAE